MYIHYFIVYINILEKYFISAVTNRENEKIEANITASEPNLTVDPESYN